MRESTKRYLIIGASAAAVILILASWLILFPLEAAYRRNVDEKFTIKIESPSPVEHVIKLLEPYLKSPASLRHALRIKSMGKEIAPGYYTFDKGTQNIAIIRRILYRQQTPFKLVISGNIRTMERLAAILGERLMADSASFAKAFADSANWRGFSAETLPALIIPNTYEIWWTITPYAFMERMHKEYNNFWNSARRAKAQEVGLTPVEVSILASIVCEESNNRAELSVIAGVYMNRLKRGIKLDADPTVRFAVGDFTLRRILNIHLKVQSPYNTYLNRGLPPGPITIPSIAGIDAVLGYAHHNYLFFCASPTFDGTHRFATTLAEHNRNADQYRTALAKYLRNNR